MEIKILLALLFLLYTLPEFFRKKKKKYEYPDIPDKVPEPLPEKSPIHLKAPPQPVISSPAISTVASQVKQATTMPPPVSVPYTNAEISPWDGKLEPSLVLNGVIFAEILQPPRALRPMVARPIRRQQ